MFNNDDEHDDDASAPRGFVAGLMSGLLTGLLTGLAVGGLVGAVSMLLLAPQSGKRTRAKLQRQGQELRDQTAETVEDAVAQAQVTASHIKHDIRKQAKELEHAVTR